MNRFFDDWVFAPGFPHFDIDSLEVVNIATHQFSLHTRQKSKGNSVIYEMKVEVNFTDGINDTTLILLMDNATNSFPITLSFNPTWYSIDRNDHMGDAISDFEKKLFITGTNSFLDTYSNVNVVATGGDTSIVRAELHWVKPDSFKNASNHPGIRLSDYRYWKFDGIFKPGFLAKVTLNYNGSTNTTSGHLDNNLITGNEDSLVLFYRSSVKEEWQIVNGYIINTGNKFDKIGSMTIDTLKRGEYAMGFRDFTTGLSNPSNPSRLDLQIWPNPSTGNVNFKSEGAENQYFTLEIFNAEGKNILNTQIKNNQPFIWAPHKGQNGVFVARIQNENKHSFSKTFQVISF
ncbi:MAG: T9SS type A sorting domain-containing protein [Bacteroidetes bacterium]|nr:T9SS type A sorting domain-containing protein [Bacteroidota bacterium]